MGAQPHKVATRWDRRARVRWRAARGIDLIAAHLDVFQYPGPENRRPSELAAETRMSKQALNYLLGQLEQLGYLTRESDDRDQRSRRIRLTPRGQAVINAMRAIVGDVEAEWRQNLGTCRFTQLLDLLTQLQAITAHPDRQT